MGCLTTSCARFRSPGTSCLSTSDAHTLDALLPAGAPHSRLITPVSDRPGHAAVMRLIQPGSAASWAGSRATALSKGWCRRVREQGGYSGGRLGVLAGAR